MLRLILLSLFLTKQYLLCHSISSDVHVVGFCWNQQIFNICLDTIHVYPQSHLKFDGGAWPGVPERKALSQRHVLLSQQTAQRHRQIPQGAFVLVIFYLCIKKEYPL